ncbi:MAG: MBL fold metallo-hydrolase [Treponemataceae bacterium]|nr:MBL fold metallo-hydrolase [Treponemataceae bacterium]
MSDSIAVLEKFASEGTVIKIDENIYRIPFVTQPISCDVIFIPCSDCTWIFDVGLNKTSLKVINAIPGKKKVVISHFHPDHIINLAFFKYDELYVSKNTKRYTFKGTVVTDGLDFDINLPDGKTDKLSVLPFPSCHAKGCLCMVFGNYAFMGDGTYCKEKGGKHIYDANLMADEIEALEKLNCEFVCLDHDPNFVQKRSDLIELHKKIYSRRDKNLSYICVDDFFADDGSVKQDYTI